MEILESQSTTGLILKQYISSADEQQLTANAQSHLPIHLLPGQYKMQ